MCAIFAGSGRLRDRSDCTERHAPEDEEMSKDTYPWGHERCETYEVPVWRVRFTAKSP
jgi:hypothetical protein